jgi:hypothetical protein
VVRIRADRKTLNSFILSEAKGSLGWKDEDRAKKFHYENTIQKNLSLRFLLLRQ